MAKGIRRGFFLRATRVRNGALATLVYSAYGYFMASELFEAGAGGPEAPGLQGRLEARQHITTRDERRGRSERATHAERAKDWADSRSSHSPWARFLSDLGLLVVSCEHGTCGSHRPASTSMVMRERPSCRSPRPERLHPELDELYDALVYGKPVLHSGRWVWRRWKSASPSCSRRRHTGTSRCQHQVAVPDGV